ncbi:MAG: hypothetical protein QM479_11155 [Pseudomonadota bacterium]
MKISDSSEAFTFFVINQISPEIKKSLTAIQLNEIKSAIAASTPLKKHSVDIRGVIPLFFTRFYFVFLLGRDKRLKTKKAELNRRNEGDILVSILLFAFFTLPLLFFLILVIYITKTELNIDLFSEFHFLDLFE